jgi:hypothetical protein
MMDKEMADVANKLFDEAHSNQEAPLIGYILTPICLSCKNVNMHYGTWDDPECSVYETIPPEFINAKTKNCPHYVKDSKKKGMDPFTSEDIKKK